jgi:hypothetical protein
MINASQEGKYGDHQQHFLEMMFAFGALMVSVVAEVFL